MTPTSVQLSRGTVKYDIPSRKVSASIFPLEQNVIACMITVAANFINILGFVDLFNFYH